MSARPNLSMPQGIVRGLDIDAYHAISGAISKSGLDDIERSPAIFHALHLDPARPPRQEKAGQLHGQLAHCAVLEPAEFDRRYVVGPALNRNTTAWKAFVADNAGRVAIQPDQYEAAMRQADSVRRLPEIREALARGEAEASAFWTDPETGVACRCRPDWTYLPGAGAVLCDLKTFSDASAAEFARQIARKRYHVQDAFYSDGYALAAGVPVLGFIFIAVETEWPYAASAVMLDEESREAGRRAARRNLDTYAECLRTNTWPGFGQAIEIVSLPAWALTSKE